MQDQAPPYLDPPCRHHYLEPYCHLCWRPLGPMAVSMGSYNWLKPYPPGPAGSGNGFIQWMRITRWLSMWFLSIDFGPWLSKCFWHMPFMFTSIWRGWRCPHLTILFWMGWSHPQSKSNLILLEVTPEGPWRRQNRLGWLCWGSNS